MKNPTIISRILIFYKKYESYLINRIYFFFLLVSLFSTSTVANIKNIARNKYSMLFHPIFKESIKSCKSISKLYIDYLL